MKLSFTSQHQEAVGYITALIYFTAMTIFAVMYV